MTQMDWDEFVRRGEERRAARKTGRLDRVSVVLGCVIFCLVVFLIVWGLMA